MSQMFLNVVSTFKGDGLGAATRQLGAFGKAAGGLGGTLGKVGAALASFGIATKAVQFTQGSIESARDLERNLFSVKTIFDDLSPTMIRFTRDASEIGLSQKDAAKAVTFLGSVLKQSGFAMDDVTTETQKLVTLGVDLAATYGYDVQEALLGMTALFRGEYDPIEKFGVAMKQSEINSELAARGLDHLTGSSRRHAEQVIRMELLYQRAADASGAFTAQSGNLFVEQKKLSAEFENMQATVGTALLPAMGELVEVLKPLVDVLTPRLVQTVKDAQPAIQTLTDLIRDMGDQTTTTGAVVNGFADLLGYVFRLASENFGVLIQLAALFGGVRIAVSLATGAIAAFSTVSGAWIAGLTLAAGAVIILNDASKKLGYSVGRSRDALVVTNKELEKSNDKAILLKESYGVVRLTFKEASDEAKRLGKEVARADEATLNRLKAQVEGLGVSATYTANELRRMAMQAGVKLPGEVEPEVEPETTVTTTGGATKKQPSIMGTLKAEATKSKLATKLIGKGLMEGLAEQIVDRGPKAARNQLKKIRNTAGAHATKLNNIYKKTAAGKAELDRIQAENDRIAQEEKAKNDRIAEELAEKERQRVEEQQRVYKSFADSVKSLFGSIRDSILGAFDITGLGGSTNSILRNMEKMLTRLRSFSASVKQLATMGLDPALLQQIIGMGPMAGATLAARLVQGGAGALASINAGYGEFGRLATDIATTGTNAMFSRDQQQTIYNINVNGGVGSGATIGKAIVDAIKDYERTSGAVWQGA